MTINFENVLYFAGRTGEIKRTPAQRLNDVFNILDFGADASKTNDSTAAMQAAVNAAGNSAAFPNGGGRVYVPHGQFKITQPIDLSSSASGLIISGDGRNSILIGTFPGFLLCWAGQLGGGGGAVQLTAAANNGSGLIRFTVQGTGQSPGFAPIPTKLIAQNMPYTVSISGGTGSVGALNGTVQRFIIVNSTQIDVIGSTWGAGGTLSSGSLAGGSNANTALTIADLTVENDQFDALGNSGAVYIGYSSNQSNVRNCALYGFVGADVASNIWIGGSFGVSVSDCILNCTAPSGQADRSNTGGSYAGMAPGSVGLFIGEGIAWNCRAQLYDVGFAVGGSCPNLIGCSVERSNIGLYIGKRDDNATDTAQGGTYLGTQFERCNQPIIVQNTGNSLIAGSVFLSSTGTPDFSNFAGGAWSAGTVTLTTQNPHHITGSAYININNIGTLNAFLANWIPPNQRQNAVLCTVATTTTLTYALSVSPAGGISFTGGTWTLGPIAAVTVINASYTTFLGNDTSDFPNISYDLSSSFGNHQNCVIQSDKIAAGILAPVATNKAAWKFVNCGTTNFISMNFADLPGPGNTQPLAIVGQEYFIVDGQTFSGAAGADNPPRLGGLVRGGGSATLKVWYSGVDWYCTSAPAQLNLATLIANLPATATAGMSAMVTNGVAAPTFGAAVGSTTGAVASPVYFDGTIWRYG